jgi:hypothetical protein
MPPKTGEAAESDFRMNASTVGGIRAVPTFKSLLFQNKEVDEDDALEKVIS